MIKYLTKNVHQKTWTTMMTLSPGQLDSLFSVLSFKRRQRDGIVIGLWLLWEQTNIHKPGYSLNKFESIIQLNDTPIKLLKTEIT